MKPLKLSKLVRATVPIMARRPPFGRVGVHPFEMLEIGGVLELAEGREAMLAIVGGGRRGEEKAGQ